MTGVAIFNNPIPSTRMSDAAKVFCFDMLIGNLDRRINKPNVFHTAEGFILFDHEQAFPFSRPLTMLGGYPSAWDFIREEWSRNHVFFPGLRGRDCLLEIEAFVMILDELSGNIFDKIEEQIPAAWRTPDLQALRNYLLNARDNAQLFKRSLQEILA
jgi:hypothetical protein